MPITFSLANRSTPEQTIQYAAETYVTNPMDYQLTLYESNSPSYKSIILKDINPGQTNKVTRTFSKGTYRIVLESSRNYPVSYSLKITGKYAVTISPKKKFLTVGETFTPTIGYADELTKTWSSSNTAVATVSAKGVIKAKAAGSAVISCALSNGKTLKVAVYVGAINATGRTLVAGNSLQLKVSNSSKLKVTWTSKDKTVAKVDSTGLVKAVGVGRTKIIANVNGDKTFSCTIAVNPGLNIATKQTIAVSEKFTAKVVGASGKVTWTSSNPKVASVSSSGVVKALKKGTTVISAKIANGPTLKSTLTVKGLVSIKLSAPVKNTATKTYQSTLTITNNSIKKTIDAFGVLYEGTYKGCTDPFPQDLTTDFGLDANFTIKPGKSLKKTIDLSMGLLSQAQLYKKTNVKLTTYYLYDIHYTDGTYIQDGELRSRNLR